MRKPAGGRNLHPPAMPPTLTPQPAGTPMRVESTVKPEGAGPRLPWSGMDAVQAGVRATAGWGSGGDGGAGRVGRVALVGLRETPLSVDECLAAVASAGVGGTALF